MAITSTQRNMEGIGREASGSFLDDAGTPAAANITLGFTLTYFAWHSTTVCISYEWFDGMADGTTLKTVANGTRTLDTADVAIDVDGDDVTIAAASILQNEQIRWIARGA